MRIRKNAKLSPLLYTTSSVSPIQALVCQLNQSPWDVINFSPPPSPPLPPSHQGNGDGGCAENGSSRDSIAVLQRGTEEVKNAAKWEYSGDTCGGFAAAEADHLSDDSINPIVLCCKTDGKSWKCRREAAKGNSLCDHHLSMVRSYGGSAQSTAKHSAKPAAEGRRRPRVKKPAVASSSNPYVFYYYSGFGPRWGKKRGEDVKNVSGVDMDENVDDRHLIELSTLSESDEEFEYDDDVEEENGKKRARKKIKARSLKSLI